MKTKSGVQKGRQLMLSTVGLVWSLPNQPGEEVRSTDRDSDQCDSPRLCVFSCPVRNCLSYNVKRATDTY